jgi:hypothetical protein
VKTADASSGDPPTINATLIQGHMSGTPTSDWRAILDEIQQVRRRVLEPGAFMTVTDRFPREAGVEPLSLRTRRGGRFRAFFSRLLQ